MSRLTDRLDRLLELVHKSRTGEIDEEAARELGLKLFMEMDLTERLTLLAVAGVRKVLQDYRCPKCGAYVFRSEKK